MSSYSSVVLSNWDKFVALISSPDGKPVVIDGASLDLASITAVSRYANQVALAKECIPLVEQSAQHVLDSLEGGATIYAVNTGVGGSADTRTDKVELLQQAIIRTLNNGVINDNSIDDISSDTTGNALSSSRMPISSEGGSTTLPQTWVKAAQLVRSNSLACGNSGVRMDLLDSLVQMIQKDVTPQVPLRGSISASGDLSPLSYLAGALQGNPGIKVWVGEKESRKLIGADVGMRQAKIEAVKFAPKEGVALVNGTSVSAGAAALVMQEAHGCAILGQVLTAMAVEALNGTNESFDPYIGEVRPHLGQRDAGSNILHFLIGSKFAREPDSENISGLRQDRYSLRTSTQWMGPDLENLHLAHEQVVTECNSNTDNPLVKPDGTVIQGGNFQATSITSAMDKTRLALQTVGRMIFQQLTELMNPAMNNGLPPNLTSDEPSCDFLMKGMDISAASYQSELSFLSHSVMPFVMVAEQGNQSLNSLALVSTRYTSTALDVFMCLAANQLVALCQALDLRAIQYSFLAALRPVFDNACFKWTQKWLDEVDQREAVGLSLWAEFNSEYGRHPTLDYSPRFKATMKVLLASAITQIHHQEGVCEAGFYQDISQWADDIASAAFALFTKTMDEHNTSKTIPLLGLGSRRMYPYVREHLNIPFLRNEISQSRKFPLFKGTEEGTLLGTYTSRVYRALKQGTAMVIVMECLRDSLNSGDKVEVLKPKIETGIAARSSHNYKLPNSFVNDTYGYPSPTRDSDPKRSHSIDGAPAGSDPKKRRYVEEEEGAESGERDAHGVQQNLLHAESEI